MKAVIHSFHTVELAYEGSALEMAMNQRLVKWWRKETSKQNLTFY
jgi:hypothetical protein